MPADRPSKIFRRDTQRPFKIYNVCSDVRSFSQPMTTSNIPFTTQQPQQILHLSQSEQQQPQQILHVSQSEQQPQEILHLSQTGQQQPQQIGHLSQSEQQQPLKIRHLSQSEQQQQFQQIHHLSQSEQQFQQIRHLSQSEQQQHQQIRLPQPQEQQQHQQPHPSSSQLSQGSLQLFADHVNIQQNSPQQQSIQNVVIDLEPANFLYDQLGLDNPGSDVLQSDLLTSSESLIQAREHNLSVSGVPWRVPGNLVQNVCVPNESASKPSFNALMSTQDPQVLTFDNVPSTSSSSQRACVVTSTAMSSFCADNDQLHHNGPSLMYNMSLTSQPHNMPFSSNGVSLPGTSMNKMTGIGQFPVKMEGDDENVMALGNVNTFAAVPQLNSPNGQYFSHNFRTSVRKTFPESSSSTANLPLVDASMGNALLVSPLHTTPEGHFYQDTFPRATRSSFSESPISSTSASSECSATSPVGHSVNGEVSRAEGSKNSSYQEKRRKNNESAKKSRDARRIREYASAMKRDHLVKDIYCAETEVKFYDNQNESLREILYTMDQYEPGTLPLNLCVAAYPYVIEKSTLGLNMDVAASAFYQG